MIQKKSKNASIQFGSIRLHESSGEGSGYSCGICPTNISKTVNMNKRRDNTWKKILYALLKFSALALSVSVMPRTMDNHFPCHPGEGQTSVYQHKVAEEIKNLR